MAKQNDLNTIAGVSKEAVQKATGISWEEWITFLDDHNATSLSHKEIVKILSNELNKAWWCQKIANGYERERGLKTLGETADAGFQIGVSKTFDLDKDTLWDLISSPDAMRIWLGETKDVINPDDQTFTTNDGIEGRIKVLKPGSHFRMTWQPMNWKQPSVLQVRVVGKGLKSVLTFHHEKLPGQAERENMRMYWTGKINQLMKIVNEK